MARSDLPDTTVVRRHQHAHLFHDRGRMRIGLLGGSFNPAHEGHLHVAQLARRALGLDQVWWMVSPQNPLKTSHDMAPLDVRLRQARQMAVNTPWIRVFAPEAGFRTNLTHATLRILRQRCPRHRFCWLMGADNLHGFRRWQHHDIIAQTVPIAVLDRPGYSYRAISAGRYLLKDRQPVARFRMMALGAHSKPPVWCFIAGRRHHASATALRQAGQDPASQGAFVESHN